MSKYEPTIDFGYPTPAHGRIPSFANIEEEAEFWDTQDFTDFVDETWPVEVIIGGELADRRSVRPEEADRDEAGGSDG